MKKMDWIIFVTNANKKTDNLEGCMDKDAHNSHTNFEIEHQILADHYTAYLFIGYHFCIGYTWIIICNLQIQLLQLLLTF